MNLTQPANSSILANLLRKEIEFQNEIQANNQTERDCEIKQKTKEHSETLPIHHE